MPNASGWKQFERDAAALIGGRRYWSNSGAALDCEGPTCVAQCKYVRTLSLAKLGELAEQVEREAAPKFKAGVVIVKQSGNKGGRRSPTLVVMTETTWRAMHGPITSDARSFSPS
jgi:hypothetical protein